MGMGGRPVNLQSFWSLKKGNRTFNFRSSEPSPDILGPLVRYTITPGEKKINKHTTVMFLLAKNTKFHIFADRSFKPLQ